MMLVDVLEWLVPRLLGGAFVALGLIYLWGVRL